MKKGGQPLGWLPLANKGTASPIRGWLYLKDEWAKRHPIFDGLPSGGLMDYTFYRNHFSIDLSFAPIRFQKGRSQGPGPQATPQDSGAVPDSPGASGFPEEPRNLPHYAGGLKAC